MWDFQIIDNGISVKVRANEYKNLRNFASGSIRLLNSKKSFSVKYYGINGQLFGENPVKNVMNIKVETKADGSVSSSKYFF